MILSPIAFFIAGLISRFSLKLTETRWQIAVFALLALAAEGVRALLSGTRPSLRRWLVDCAAATAGLVIAKIMIEGVHG